MKRLIPFLALVLYIQVTECSVDDAVPFKDTNVNILALYTCDDGSTSAYHEIDLKNDGDKKWAYMFIKLDDDFTDDYTMKMTADQWDNGAWQENVYSTEGPFCEMSNKYAHDFYTNFREHMSPKLPEECSYQAGEYTLEDFTCMPEDFKIPSMLMGTFKVHLQIMNPAEEKIACFVCELEVSAK